MSDTPSAEAMERACSNCGVTIVRLIRNTRLCQPCYDEAEAAVGDYPEPPDPFGEEW